MVHGIVNAMSRIGHACSDFGRYFSSVQPTGCDPESGGRCEGAPSKDEAQKDYQAMIRARLPSRWM